MRNRDIFGLYDSEWEELGIEEYCFDCSLVSTKIVTVYTGNRIIEFLLLLCFIVPGIVYRMSMMKDIKVCTMCGSPNIVKVRKTRDNVIEII